MIVFASAQVDTFGQRTQGNPCSIPALLSRIHPRGASILNAVFRAVNDSGRMRLLRENPAANNERYNKEDGLHKAHAV